VIFSISLIGKHNVTRDERRGCDLEEWRWRKMRRERIILEEKKIRERKRDVVKRENRCREDR
jgi:hypothetical protein